MGLDFNLLGIRQPSQGLLPERGPGQELFAAQTQRRAQDINLFNIQANAQLRQQELAEQQRANIMQELDRVQGRELQRENLSFDREKHYNELGIRKETVELMKARLNFDISSEEFDRQLASDKFNLEEKKFARSIVDQDRDFLLREQQVAGNLNYQNRLAAIAEGRLAREIDKDLRQQADQALLSDALQNEGVQGYIKKLAEINPAEAVKAADAYAKTLDSLSSLKKGFDGSDSQVKAAAHHKYAIALDRRVNSISNPDARRAALLKGTTKLAQEFGYDIPESEEEAELLLNHVVASETEFLAEDLKAAKEDKSAQDFYANFFGSGTEIDKAAKDIEAEVEAQDPLPINSFDISRQAAQGNPNYTTELADRADAVREWESMDEASRKKVGEIAFAAKRSMVDFERIEDAYDPKVLTFNNRAFVAAAELFNKAGAGTPEGDAAIAQATNMLGNVGRWLSLYAKSISGGAIAKDEFKRLMQQTLSGELSAPAFEINLSNMMEIAISEANYALRLKGEKLLETPKWVTDIQNKYSKAAVDNALAEAGRGGKALPSKFGSISSEQDFNSFIPK